MKTINHETYVSPEIAELLKEAGFNWKCINRYIKDTDLIVPSLTEANWNAAEWGINNYKSAPTLEVAQKWLREIKHCFININIDVDDNECEDTIVVEPFTCNYIIEGFPYCNNSPGDDYIRNTHGDRKYFNIYEEAQEEGIKKILEIILEKNNKTVTI